MSKLDHDHPFVSHRRDGVRLLGHFEVEEWHWVLSLDPAVWGDSSAVKSYLVNPDPVDLLEIPGFKEGFKPVSIHQDAISV